MKKKLFDEMSKAVGRAVGVDFIHFSIDDDKRHTDPALIELLRIGGNLIFVYCSGYLTAWAALHAAKDFEEWKENNKKSANTMTEKYKEISSLSEEEQVQMGIKSLDAVAEKTEKAPDVEAKELKNAVTAQLTQFLIDNRQIEKSESEIIAKVVEAEVERGISSEARNKGLIT